MAELHESQDALAGDMVDGVEGVEEVEEIVVDAMPEPTHPARKRKSTWRGQAELINLPYKASSIFKDEKLLETIKISEDSDTKIIRKTGLLDDHELDLDLASDGSDDAEIQVLSNTDSVSAKETNNSMVTLSIGGNFQIYHLMFLARPSGAPDNIALGLHSTFDVQALRRQLKKAQASRSGAQCPLWALGFDTKVFGHAHRLLPTEPLVDNIVLTRLKASTEKKKFEEYLDSLRLYKEAAWVELQCIFDPERIGTMDEPSPQFLQLATAFFSGKEIDEDCGVVDKTQKTPIILDLGLDDLDNLSGEPSDIQEQEPVYKITNGTGDRAKVMAQDPLRDPVLATFLVDLIMSREIEKAIAQQARYKFMKVFHSSERSFIGSRLENIEKTLKQGNAYLWKKPGPVDLLLLPGGTWTYFIPASGSFNKNDTGDVVEPESRENATAEFQETKLPAAAENSAQPEPKSKKSKKKKKKPVKVNESIDSQDDPLNKVAEKTDDPESTVAPDTSTAQHTGADVTSFTVDELVAKNVSVLETAEGTNKGNGWQEVTKARAVSKTKTKASRTVSRLTASSNARLVSSTSASTIVNISKSRPSVVPSVTNAQASTIDRRVSPLMETAVITVPKVRQTRTYLTPTITPPELVDSDFPPLSTTNEPDRSDSTLRTPDHKIQSTLFKSITPSSELLANSPDFDYSSGKPVICNHNKQETGQEEAVVPNDLSWADLTSPTKFHPHQRYASLQTVSTRSKEEGMSSVEDAASAQMTSVRDFRVLSLQFGEVPVGYGLSLPDETTRKPQFHHSQSSDGSAKLDYEQTSSIREGDQSLIRSESPIQDDPGTPSLHSINGYSQYYIPSPRFSPTNHGFTEGSHHLTGAPRSHSMPCSSSTNLSMNSDELSITTELQQNGHPPEQPSKLQTHPAKPEFVPSYFTCVCCKVTRRPTPEAPVYFCPFCGPLTNVRYCSKACLLAESFDHRCHCANYPASQMLMGFDPPDHYVYDKDAISTLQKWEPLPSGELFRQKTFSMYCFTGIFPDICKAWVKKSNDRADVYPTDLDEPSQKVTGDYHIFRSKVSASGRFSPTEVLATFRIPETNPMKRDFNRLLNACFMFANMDHTLITFLYRLLRHFILHDSYYRHSFPATPREILYPEFRHQFKMEFGIYYNDNAEPPILNFVEEWPLISVLLGHYEQSYPDLVIHLMRKLPYRDPSLPTPPL